MVPNGKRRLLQTGLSADAQAGAVAIGVRLRHARLTKGLSLRAVADQVGCSESFVSKIENDKVNPSLATLHKLVRVLETNIAALFSDGPDESSVQIFRPGSRPLIRMGSATPWQGHRAGAPSFAGEKHASASQYPPYRSGRRERRADRA